MWHLNFLLPRSLALDLESRLDEVALSVSLLEADEHKDLWQVNALMETHAQAQAFMDTLGDDFRGTLSPLAEKNWVAENQKSFPPLEVGAFYIYGSHVQTPLPQGKFCLCLEASTAFGTGDHATTQGCLRALQDLCQTHSMKKPLDMGCGTGILAFAMALLLKQPVLAVDNDPEAVQKAQENARLNGLSSCITVRESEGWGSVPQQDFDLITANILAGPLCDLAPEMARHLVPQGFIILSGLLTTQAPQVLEAYARENLHLVKSYSLGDWETLVVQKTI